MTYFILPSYSNDYSNESVLSGDVLSSGKGLRDIFKMSEIVLQAASTLGATISIGFLQATLRNHINQFHLSDVSVGNKLKTGKGILVTGVTFRVYISLISVAFRKLLATLFNKIKN